MEVIVAQRAVAAHGSAVTQPLSPPHSDHSSEPGQETDHHKVGSNFISSSQLAGLYRIIYDQLTSQTIRPVILC